MNVTFLTGGTGSIGAEMIPRLLAAADGIIRVLVRASSEEQAEERLEQTLRYQFTELDLVAVRSRVTAVWGDVKRERLGLSERAFSELAEEVTHIIHSAATVKLDLPFESVSAVNVNGSRRVLELARQAYRHRLERLVHVSTFAVSGDRKGLILEPELDQGQGFRNTYERSKFLAELELRAAMKDLPINVVRPGIVIGDARTGRIRTFSAIYLPFKILFYGMIPAYLPGSPRARIELVPIDFVADAIDVIMRRDDTTSQTFHLTPGDQAPTVGEVARLAVSHFNRLMSDEPLKPVRFLPFWLRDRLYWPIAKLLRGSVADGVFNWELTYRDYLSSKASYDVNNTKRALAATTIRVPPFSDYFGRVIEYCLASDWGRRAGAIETRKQDGDP